MFSNGSKILVSRVGILNDLFDVIVIVTVRRECRISLWSKQIGILRIFFYNVKGHFIQSMLEFDGEISENLVLICTDAHLFAHLPKLLSHPIGDIGNSLDVHQKVIHIIYLLVENSA